MHEQGRVYLGEMPYDHTFVTERGEELCHSTGYLVMMDNEWWNEYVDSEGDLHYGR